MLFVNRGRFIWKSYTLAKLSLLQFKDEVTCISPVFFLCIRYAIGTSS